MCRPKRPRASNAAILSNSFGVHRYEHCVLWCQWLDELAVSILGTKICFQRTQSLHYKAGGWRRSKSRVCQLGDCGSCPVLGVLCTLFHFGFFRGQPPMLNNEALPKTAVSWVPTAGWLQKWVSHHRPQFTAEMKPQEVLSLTDTRP